MTRLAYLGPQGTFCEAALRQLPPPPEAELVPAASVLAALTAVREGSADAAMVPFENSVEGPVTVTLDALTDLASPPLQIRAESLVAVAFALLTRDGGELTGVRTVATHPHAEAQCRGWLARVLPDAQVQFTPSTAHAAALVAAGQVDAAIAAPFAGPRYGLVPLVADVADSPGAVTRFVLVAPPAPSPAATGTDRTTVVAFIDDDHPGALLALLTEFAVRGVNLTRIESRPTGLGLGRYCFSLDCEGHIATARVSEALAGLHRLCPVVRFLGSYPAAGGRPALADDAGFEASHRWVQRLRDTGADTLQG